MRAADPVENSGTADAVRIDEPDPPHHPQPVYAGGADDVTLATLSLEVDPRAWPSQLAQWLPPCSQRPGTGPAKVTLVVILPLMPSKKAA